MRKLVAIVALVGMGPVIGCREQSDATYKTATSAAEDGAFERGWLPNVLLPDTSEIRESHDLDSNRGEATFQATEQLALRVEHQCSRLSRQQQVTGPFHLEVRAGTSQFKCGDFTLALDMDHKRGYMWH